MWFDTVWYAVDYILDALLHHLFCQTFLICSTNSFLSPEYFVTAGPFSCLLASTRSSLSEDKHLANTASPGDEIEKMNKHLLVLSLMFPCSIRYVDNTRTTQIYYIIGQ